MTPEKIVENHKKYVLQSWSKQGNLNPIPVAKADGIYFYDFDGNRYTDMSSQLVNLNLGYGNKAIGDAIKEQVDKFCFVGPSCHRGKVNACRDDYKSSSRQLRKGILYKCGCRRKRKCSKDCKNVHRQKQSIQPLQKLSRFIIRCRQPYR